MDRQPVPSVLNSIAWTASLTVLKFLALTALAASQSQSGTVTPEESRTQRHLLPSLDERLHSTFIFTLAKVDLSLNQLERRLDAMDNKLNHMDKKLEQSIWARDASIHLRQTEFPGYVDIQLDKISSRLDVLEREIRELRYYPRRVEDIEPSSCRGCTNIRNASPIREMMSEVVTDNAFRLEDALKWQLKEQTVAMWERLERSLAELEDSVFTQINDTLTAIAASCSQKADNSETIAGSEETDLLFLVQKAITQSETKFRKLDSDVEKYTRKMMGSIRDLWRSSDQVKVSLEEALRLGNQTREVVRYEFQKLHQQIEPLPRLEPRLAEISATLHRNLGDLGATVDRSFSSLLVAQNAFIDNCRRLHDEETHAYDVLQAVVHEMRNRSESDMGRISADIRRHEDRLGRHFETVLEAIFGLGNNTAATISQLSSRICAQSPAQIIASVGTKIAGDAVPPRSGSGVQKSSQDYDADYQVPDNEYVDA